MPASFEISTLELPLVHPFAIARRGDSFARTAIFRVRLGEFEGIGEAAPIERYGESVESIKTYFAEHRPLIDDPYNLQAIFGDAVPPAARCGLEVALLDWIGKDLDRPLYALLGLDPRKTPVTSFTIGIGDAELTQRKLDEIGDHPILKIKLGLGNLEQEVSTIEMVRSRYTGTLRIDANEGWDTESAVAILNALERFEIEFCEQPIPAGHPEQLRYIREHTKVPLVTDEDSRFAGDLPKLQGCVDGVNVKLAKCGGVHAALGMIHTARALGLKVMIGAMVESSVLATAAAHLSPLADWADIDGPFLTASDPFSGVTYDRGKLVLPDGPGLGVREMAVR
jgi:L-Ala-D/L-Glu epimerase / N-acetyl-D-glutamate racemase